MKRSTLVEIISAMLILLFLYTGVIKFLDFKVFIHDMDNQPFPNWMTPYLVWTIPTIEIIISIALLFNNTRKPGLWAACILMSLFSIYTAAVLLHFFDRVPCSCGGVIKNLTWKQHLLFNLFFEGISIAGILLINKRTKQKAKEIHQVVFT
jgi:putative oxidoreductase